MRRGAGGCTLAPADRRRPTQRTESCIHTRARQHACLDRRAHTQARPRARPREDASPACRRTQARTRPRGVAPLLPGRRQPGRPPAARAASAAGAGRGPGPVPGIYGQGASARDGWRGVFVCVGGVGRVGAPLARAAVRARTAPAQRCPAARGHTHTRTRTRRPRCAGRLPRAYAAARAAREAYAGPRAPHAPARAHTR